ncbi:MAG: hypothetical protein HUK28_05770 [Methanobrevibacter sp.]|nr:hypothetical protein [Methanobrevibacter sp.]
MLIPVNSSENDIYDILDYVFYYYGILRAKFSDNTLNIAPYHEDDFVFEAIDIPFSNISSFMDNVNLSDDELVKSYYLSTEKDNYLLMVISDILVDNNSLDIILESIGKLINLQENNRELHLSNGSIVFFNYLNHINEYLDSYGAKNESFYWNEILGGIERVNISNNIYIEDDFNLVYVPIDVDLYDKSIYKSFNINIEQLIVAAFSYTLSKLTNKVNIAFDIDNCNRTSINDEVNILNTVGNFDYYYPINIHVKDDLKNHILEVKENINYIPNNGVGYSINHNIQKDKCDLDILLDYNHYNENMEGIINILGEGILEKSYKDKYSSYNYDLIFNITDYNGKMAFKLFYRNINQNTVKEIADLFNETLNDMVSIAKSSDNIKTISDFIRINYNGLTKLNEGNDGTNPLFLLYPGHGDSSGYVHLAQKLNKKIPLYAIEPHSGFKDNNIKGIENLAREYIKVIKQYQDQGPYNLLGWSYGGLLAFEIARQLKKQGETINNIYILDSRIFNEDSSKIFDIDKETEREHIEDNIFEKFGNVYIADFLFELLNDAFENVKDDMLNYKPDIYDDKIKLFKCIIKLNEDTLNIEEISSEELEEDYYNGFDSCVDINNIKVYESRVLHEKMGNDDEFFDFLIKIIEDDYNIN